MFDINAVMNAAIKAAVDESLSELRTSMAQDVLNVQAQLATVPNSPLSNQVQCLEADLARLSAQLVTLAEKTAALAGQVQPTSEGMDLRKLIKAELMDLLTSDDDVQQKLHGMARSVADEAVSDHCDEYDHDSFDEAASAIEDLDVDELVKAEDLQSEVKEILEGASFSVTF